MGKLDKLGKRVSGRARRSEAGAKRGRAKRERDVLSSNSYSDHLSLPSLPSTLSPVGGPFSAKQGGSVGKAFESDGAVGGKVQEASDETWDKGKDVKADS